MNCDGVSIVSEVLGGLIRYARRRGKGRREEPIVYRKCVVHSVHLHLTSGASNRPLICWDWAREHTAGIEDMEALAAHITPYALFRRWYGEDGTGLVVSGPWTSPRLGRIIMCSLLLNARFAANTI